MSLEGDFAKLEALGRKLSSVERGAVAAELKSPLEGVALDLYQQSFRQQQGPIGGAWPESPNRMFLTGELANPDIAASGLKLTVGAPPYYARFHQGGWKTGGERVKFGKRIARIGGKGGGPARPVLPTQNTAGEWEGPLQDVINQSMTDFFQK